MRPLSCVCVRSAAPVSSSSRVLSHTRKRTFHVKHPTFAAYPRRSRALPRLRALAPALRASRSCASLASRPGLRILAPRPHPPPLARTPRARAPRSHPRPRPRPPAPPAPPGPPRRPPAGGPPTHPRVAPPGRAPPAPRLRVLPASRVSRPRASLAPPPAPRASLASPPLAGPERLTSRPLPRNPCSRLLHPSCSPVAPPFPFVALSMPGLSKSKRHQLRFYQHLHSTSTFATQQLSGRLNDRLSAFTQVTGGFSPRNNREGALTRPHEASMVILGELNSLTGINET